MVAYWEERGRGEELAGCHGLIGDVALSHHFNKPRHRHNYQLIS